MSKFRYAWHMESERMLEPDDVTDFIMETGRTPELMCPDENCRLESPRTRIAAVCCDPRKPKCGFTPHFRTHPGHRHAKNCQYEILGRHTDYILEHKDEFAVDFPDANLLLKIDGINSEFLPDAFVEEFAPREFMEEVNQTAQKYRRAGNSNEQAVRRARCAVPQKTSRLGLVVDMALKLAEAGGDGLREKVRLSLPNRQNANYLNAFLMLGSLKEHYTTPYILCGDATVHKIQHGYLIRYENTLKYYRPDSELAACTLINPDQYKATFLEELSGYAASGEVCSVYSFSTHDLKESTCPMLDKKRCVVIEPRFRDAVVIRNRCLKRGQNNTR